MRSTISPGLLAFGLAFGLVLTASLGGAEPPPPQQPIEALRPPAQQEVEVLRPVGAQGVSGVDVVGKQEIGVPQPVTPAQRAASTAGKIAVGLVAVAVAAGMTVVSLFFL